MVNFQTLRPGTCDVCAIEGPVHVLDDDLLVCNNCLQAAIEAVDVAADVIWEGLPSMARNLLTRDSVRDLAVKSIDAYSNFMDGRAP